MRRRYDLVAGGWGLGAGGGEERGSRKFSWFSDVNPGEPGSIEMKEPNHRNFRSAHIQNPVQNTGSGMNAAARTLDVRRGQGREAWSRARGHLHRGGRWGLTSITRIGWIMLGSE